MTKLALHWQILIAIVLASAADRVLDMVRTSVNMFGDACCAVIVATMDGEETNLANRRTA